MSKEVTPDNHTEKFIKITSTGNIDLEITLSLTSEEAEAFGIFPEKIETIADCEEFLKQTNLDNQQMTFKTEQFKKANIYDFIRLGTNNSTINSLLVINRAFKKKAFIEFITMSELKFKENESFLHEFVKSITEQNFLFLVENNFLHNLDSKIKFVIKIDNRVVKEFANICLSANQAPENINISLNKNSQENQMTENNEVNNIISNDASMNLENKENTNEVQQSRENISIPEAEELELKKDNSIGKISSPTNVHNNQKSHEYENENNIKIGNNPAVLEHRQPDEDKEELKIRSENYQENLSLEKTENSQPEPEAVLNLNGNNENNINNKSNNNDLFNVSSNKIINSIHNKSEKKSHNNSNNLIVNNVNNNNAEADLNNYSKIIKNHSVNNDILNEQSDNNENMEKNGDDLLNNNLTNINLENKFKILADIGAENELIVKDKIFNIEENESNKNKDYVKNINSKNDIDTNKLANNDLMNENNEVKNSGNKDNSPALSIFERFKYDFNGSDYFFVDLNDILEFKKLDFSISDFYNLLKKIADEYKKISIIINFPNIINSIGFLNLESINILNEIIGLTDIFIFDKKDALALFNLMAQINSEEDNYEDKKNLEQLFLQEVKKKRKIHPKIGIFLDELKRVTIIEQQSSSNLILFHTDYEFNLIPANVSKVVADDYKKLFVVHYENLKSVFVGGLFSRMLYRKPFNSGFMAGNESLKRIIELLRFNLDYPLDPNFYLIRIKKNAKLPNDDEKFKKKKEQRFVLDSTNLVNSKMKIYNPLYDDNLSSFFSSKFIRKHLMKLGFINKKGSILQDPDNKKLGVIESKKLNKIYEEEKVNLQKIKDKKEKLQLQIKNLLEGNNVMKSGNMKEIEKLSKVYNFYPQSEKKLPSINAFKKSINKNIKMNSEMYLCEIQKGKKPYINNKSRTKSKSPANRQSSAQKNVKPENNLLDVIEKIEDKILYHSETTGVSNKNQKKESLNNNDSNIKSVHELSASKNKHSNADIIASKGNSVDQSIKTKINVGNSSKLDSNSKSLMSEKSKKFENQGGSRNKQTLEKGLTNELENEKSYLKNNSQINNNMNNSNLINIGNNNIDDKLIDSKILKDPSHLEVQNKSGILNLNESKSDELIAEKEVEAQAEDNYNSNINNDIHEKEKENNNDNNSLLEKNMNNLSKISKNNENMGVDLNLSRKSISVNDVLHLNDKENSPAQNHKKNDDTLQDIEERNLENQEN